MNDILGAVRAEIHKQWPRLHVAYDDLDEDLAIRHRGEPTSNHAIRLEGTELQMWVWHPNIPHSTNRYMCSGDWRVEASIDISDPRCDVAKSLKKLLKPLPWNWRE